MNSRLKRALFALAAVVLMVWLVWDSSSFQSCIQNKDSALSTFGIVGIYKNCIGSLIKENKDELLAEFTIVLAFSTFFLWVATRDLANEAANASKVELRAYVSAGHPKFEKVDPDLVIIAAENGGRTPAYKVSAWINSYWIEGETNTLPDDFKFPDREQTGPFLIYRSVAVLHPEKDIPFAFDFDGTLIERVRKKEIALFLYGHIDYVDVFDKDHTTNFCYQYFPGDIGMGHSLIMYDEHNEAT